MQNFKQITHDKTSQEPSFTQTSAYTPTFSDYLLLGLVLIPGLASSLTLLQLLKPYAPTPNTEVY